MRNELIKYGSLVEFFLTIKPRELTFSDLNLTNSHSFYKKSEKIKINLSFSGELNLFIEVPAFK